ncbi:DUF4088 domain-containing protein [Cupriavidus gilardii]|uniref:DUF4088 domain-containing protein n=1 Tax=Cupriavidus gilardii TaxID=82541 RepID=A0ABY4VHF5_9BURK|nr:DUF4088 family protein [Cupriavidus gilardii]QQE08916.1 DUF4088 family protein [Cupriavidus sp. ISTL7]MCT9071368.1 DUF4088 domain-containing protein [Cupriavidus gilardii]MCT9073213.1 DUF4088 domain-containing protein [Cupriavidus gilardii]MCT9116065.1 DUF4088 domain-containing protein [Cupriavidus gilardii]MCT9124108.1 DUF4088 domain-containing protein [Cupriavidus gilardii]
MNSEITLSLPREAADKLRGEFDHFVRLSTGLDRQFVPPSFEDFLRARVMHQDGPLTERAVTRLLTGGEYAWAKRVFDKQLPHALANLMRDAERFGFGLAVRSEWSQSERLAQARKWAVEILDHAGADPALADTLAEHIANAAIDVRTIEEQMQTPAWRLADSLRRRVYDLLYLVQTERGTAAALTRLGELRAMVGLALDYGAIDAQEAGRVMEQIEHARPHLFRDEPDDVFARLAAWLRRVFKPMPAAPSMVESDKRSP